MEIITEKITLDELNKMSQKMFNHLVKAVVDIEKEIIVVDADLHADQVAMLKIKLFEKKSKKLYKNW